MDKILINFHTLGEDRGRVRLLSIKTPSSAHFGAAEDIQGTMHYFWGAFVLRIILREFLYSPRQKYTRRLTVKVKLPKKCVVNVINR